ncbi:MAG: hypothetical protein ACI8SC_002287, partial [Colwellia sp.]
PGSFSINIAKILRIMIFSVTMQVFFCQYGVVKSIGE